MSRKAYTAEGAVSVGPYSHAVESGDLIYLSGGYEGFQPDEFSL